MKKSEIGVGRHYTDGKGGLREVVAEGPQFKLYGAVADDDCLRYKAHFSSGTIQAGTENNATRTAFAAWAKSEVPAEQVAQWIVDRNSVTVAKKLTNPQRAFLSAFDRDLNLTSYSSCGRDEWRWAKACREKGLVADMPEQLKKNEESFDVCFTALGLAVLKQVHGAARP